MEYILLSSPALDEKGSFLGFIASDVLILRLAHTDLSTRLCIMWCGTSVEDLCLLPEYEKARTAM